MPLHQLSKKGCTQQTLPKKLCNPLCHFRKIRMGLHLFLIAWKNHKRFEHCYFSSICKVIELLALELTPQHLPPHHECLGRHRRCHRAEHRQNWSQGGSRPAWPPKCVWVDACVLQQTGCNSPSAMSTDEPAVVSAPIAWPSGWCAEGVARRGPRPDSEGYVASPIRRNELPKVQRESHFQRPSQIVAGYREGKTRVNEKRMIRGWDASGMGH